MQFVRDGTGNHDVAEHDDLQWVFCSAAYTPSTTDGLDKFGLAYVLTDSLSQWIGVPVYL